MPATTTRRISTKLADQLIRESGLAARDYSLISMLINGAVAFQLSRADEIVEFNAREMLGACRTLNAFTVARAAGGITIKGDRSMIIPGCDVSGLRDVLVAAAQDAALHV